MKLVQKALLFISGTITRTSVARVLQAAYIRGFRGLF
jgi:hypothetical protein